MLIVGLSVLIKGKSLSKLIREFTNKEHLQYMGGVLSLILGLLIVGSHNVWMMPLNVLLITIFGWLALLKGMTFLLLPEDTVDKLMKAFDNKTWFVLAGVFYLIVGAYFTYTWFNAIA